MVACTIKQEKRLNRVKTITIKYEPTYDEVVVNNRKCRVCLNRFWFTKDFGPSYPDNHACDDCQYWQGMWLERDNGELVFHNGRAYVIDEEVSEDYPRKITIKFKNGKTVYTNHLWQSREVPTIWQEYGLNDNAEVIIN